MSAGVFDFAIERGEPFTKTITYRTGPPPTVPFDFTGWTAKLQIRSGPGGTLYYEMNATNGKLLLGGSAGTVRLQLDALDTGPLDWEGRAYYDIRLTKGADSFRLVEGRVALGGIAVHPADSAAGPGGSGINPVGPVAPRSPGRGPIVLVRKRFP